MAEMSMEREAEVLEMPTQNAGSLTHARKLAQGRAAVERYVVRLENASQGLRVGPEASELYCALAELREGLHDNDLELAEKLYRKALEAFKFSQVANLGLRRLRRGQKDFVECIASLEREIATAKPKRKYSLSLELARTYLYASSDAERALSVLEQLELFATDPEAHTLVPEIEAARDFDAELFFLWEDALIALGDWERYEQKLREALRQQKTAGPMLMMLQERLWVVYRTVLADQNQADILCKYLIKNQNLDDELIDYEIERAKRSGIRDDLVDILSLAVERDLRTPHEVFYRIALADIANYEYEDKTHAADILREGVNHAPNDLLLLHKLITVESHRNDKGGLLDALNRSLEAMQSPKLKAKQLHKIACILKDMDQEDAAIDVLLEANSICPSYGPSLDALSEIYRREGQWAELAQVLEYELSYASEQEDESYSVECYIYKHSNLAWIYEQKLNFSLKAFNHYQAILKHRPDDILALKGASRMTDSIGNWTELLKLYASAEACTQDVREHAYLLERIADIAETYLDDPSTACTALEARQALDVPSSSKLSALARLYVKLNKWEALLSLTDAEIELSKNPEYRASLLCRNAEIAECKLSDIPRAIGYFEKARLAMPANHQANEALARLYAQQGLWEKHVEILKAMAQLTQDRSLKCYHLRRLASTLWKQLDGEEEAIEIYEFCIKLNPQDEAARKVLLDHYENAGRWEEVLRILNVELAAGGSYDEVWLSYYRMGQIQRYRLGDKERAFKAYRSAFLAKSNNVELFRIWLDLALELDRVNEVIETAKEIHDQLSKPRAKYALEHAIVEYGLRDKYTLPELVDYVEAMDEHQTSVVSRLMVQLSSAIDAQKGRWNERLALGLLPGQPHLLQTHALMACMVLDMPQSLKERAHEVLLDLEDVDLARQLWVLLPISQRPSFKLLTHQLLDDPSHEGQDLRRWTVISSLLAGDVSDPTESLLPDNRDVAISYRPDLELLAAYFESSEKWLKLLEVLSIQEENTLNEQEKVQVILQRAWVLSKLRRRDDALECVRNSCASCSYTNPMRMALYDYLTKEEDWDFLAEQIRQELMHSEDSGMRATLWMRLAEIYGTGMGNPEESLRCLDQAYHANPLDGSILGEISQTAQKIGELEIARRALDDFLQYHEPSLEDQLALQPQLLTLHFEHPGGDTPRMLEYFEHLVKRTAQSRECLVILARAHALAGDPQVAAEIILRLVAYPFVDEDLELWMILADLYLKRLGEAIKGEELLWKLFSKYPSYVGLFEQLNTLYVTPTERRIFVENLRNYAKSSQTISKDPALMRRFLSFAAQILGSELGLWSEAQDLYSEALDVSAEPSDDLVKNRAYARCRVPGEAKSAYEEFCQLLVNDPFQEDIYRAALDICRRNDAHDRSRILKQLAEIFVPNAGLHRENEAVRPKLMDARPLSDQLLQRHLCHPSLRLVQPVLHEAMPILNTCFRDIIPKRTQLGGERVKNQQIQDVFAMAAMAFGLGNIKGAYGHDDTAVPLVFDDPSSYWIARDVWAELKAEAQRHWAGYAGGMLWTGVSRLIHFDPNELWHILDGIYYTVTNRGIIERDAYTIEAAQRIETTFTRGTRKEVARLIDDLGPENLKLESASKWIEGLYYTADRAGLLFSGSLSSSLPAILTVEGWDASKMNPDYLAARFESSRRILELIAFGLSDDYLILRHHAGLSMRPSVISG